MSNYKTLVDVLIKDELAGVPRHEQVLFLGQTPEYLVKRAGFPDLNLAIKSSVIIKSCFDHGIANSLLKRVPEIILKPKCVFRSANPELTDSVVVLTFEVKGASPIIIPIRQNQQVGRNSYFNLVSSIYGKDGPDPFEKWKNLGF